MDLLIYSVMFGNLESHRRLAQVLEHSLKEHMPFANIEVEWTSVEKVTGTIEYRHHHAKLLKWHEVAMRTDVPTILCDCDMYCRGDISDAFEHEFDIAYTERSDKQLPLNGGVLFLRPTEAMREFFSRWIEIDRKMIRNQKIHNRWKSKYAGLNQSSFGYMLEHKEYRGKVTALPSSVYNACGNDWKQLDTARMVHVKSSLRKDFISGKWPRELYKRQIFSEIRSYPGGIVPIYTTNRELKMSQKPKWKQRKLRRQMEKEGGNTGLVDRTDAELDRQAEIVAEVVWMLDRYGMKSVLWGGVVLGIVRDGDFIRWDWDADICVPMGMLEQYQSNLVSLMKKQGYEILKVEEGKLSRKVDAQKGHYKVTVAGWVKDSDVYKRMSNMQSSNVHVMPSFIFDHVRWYTIRGKKVPIPYYAEDMCSWMYGEWRVPKRVKSGYLSSEFQRRKDEVPKEAGSY